MIKKGNVYAVRSQERLFWIDYWRYYGWDGDSFSGGYLGTFFSPRWERYEHAINIKSAADKIYKDQIAFKKSEIKVLQ